MKLLPALCTLAASLLLASGCTRPEDAPKPPDLLPKEQMVSLLIKLHLLEARIETSRLSPDSARALFLAQKRELLWQRHIADQDSAFEHSYRYYAVHNKDLDEIYTAVTDSLDVVQKSFGTNTAPPLPPHH